MQRDAGHHRDNESDNECSSRVVHGGDAAHRNNGSEMVEAYNRMTKPQQHAFTERGGGPAAHDVMGRRIAGAEDQGRQD
jgi:hypothetical protein